MTSYYLDTSIAYHALVGTPSAAEWFDRIDNEDPGALVSSRLLRTELTRALRRDGTPVQDRDAVLDKVAQVPLTESVLVGAEAITEHVKTLDAIPPGIRVGPRHRRGHGVARRWDQACGGDSRSRRLRSAAVTI